MTPDGRQIITESDSIIYQSTGSEANKIYKINGIYYHYFSEVKSEGRVVMMGRSKNIYGPYETKQLNHVNKSKDREPNQGGLIKLESGDWWFLTHHGSTGNSQYSFSIDGRIFETFGKPYKLTWGKYRGDRIGIFCYNSTEEKGYVDVDWFHYDY